MALNILNQLVTQYPGSAMGAKAATMIDVLSRRESIEKYLANLEIERVKEGQELAVFDDTKIEKQVAKPTRPITENVPVKKAVIPQTVTISAEKKLPEAIKKAGYIFDANSAQNVIMIMTKVDPVYSLEARNAFTRYNGQRHYNLNLKVSKDTLNKEKAILIFSSFISAEEAIKYMDRIRKDAPAEVSWLPADKYKFYIISDSNLGILKSEQNLQDYLDLLNSRYPGKF